MKEAKQQAARSQAEKIQQAEEQHAGGQLADAELDRLQANGEKAPAEEEAQVAQEKIERLLGQEAKKLKATQTQQF